ncbi:MAG: hypothetical protein OMM_11392, partial [Candidatus Magnetoglobus multicellularis str. Araruama]
MTISNVFGSYDDYQYSYYEEPACSADGICLTFELADNKKTFQTFVSKADDSSFVEGGTALLFWRTETALVESVEFEAGATQIIFEFNDPIRKGHPGHGNYFVLINKLSGSPLLTGSIYISTEYATSCSTVIDGDDIHIWYSSISGEGTKNALVYYMPEGVGYWDFFTEKKAGYSIDVNCSYENFDNAYLCKYVEQDETYKFTVSTGYDVIVKYVHEPLTISGYITSGNTFIGGVELIGFPKTPDTEANGYYETQVPYGWSGTVHPEIWGHTFEPETVSYSNVTANISQNYSLIEIDKAILSFPHKYVNQNETGLLGLGLVNSIPIKECTIQFSYDATAGFDIVELTLTKRSENLSVSFSKDERDHTNVKVTCHLSSEIDNRIDAGSGNIISFIYSAAHDGSGAIALKINKAGLVTAQNNSSVAPTHHDGKISFYIKQDTEKLINIEKTVIAEENHSSMEVACYGNNVYLFVDSYKNHLAKFYRSYDSGRSFDSGIIFGSEVKDVELKVNSNGHIHLFWNNFDHNLNYTQSLDNGATFSKPRAINKENSDYQAGTDYNCFIDKQDNIYFVFQHSSGSKRDLSYIISKDNGKTFSTPVQVTYDEIQEDRPKIFVYNETIYITYWELSSQNIYLINSADNYSNAISINIHPVQAYGYDFAINDYGEFFIVYSAIIDDDIELFIGRSLDHGLSFGPSPISSPSSGEQSYPKMYLFNNLVHLAWNDHRNNNYDIYYTKSIDKGATYEHDTNTSQQPDDQYIQDISADNTRVYIIANNQQNQPNTTDLYILNLIDNESPSIHIKTPTNLSNPNNLTKITGTASDENSGIYQVEIQLSDGNNYWYSNKEMRNGYKRKSGLHVMAQ